MTLQRRTFLKRLGLGVAAMNTALLSSSPLAAKEATARRVMARSAAAAQGVSAAGLLRFMGAACDGGHELHSFMMARHGHVVAEGWWAPYRRDAVHSLYSLSKSFTSTAIGFAVAEQRLRLDDRVVTFFPDQLPPHLSEHLWALQVEHLLTMSVGHAEDSTPVVTQKDDWVRAFLSLPIKHPPGSAFLYESSATYMLSAIVQRVSGQKVLDYLRPRLFEPLGLGSARWTTCPLGINTGGWGLSTTTDALAKFGQFYLQQGAWNGRQLLPAEWVERATTARIQQPATFLASPSADPATLKTISDWHQGYGYQFWRCRHNAFRGDGAFGQFCIVMPEHDAVVAITSRSSNLQELLDLVWEYVLPAIAEGGFDRDETAEANLERELASLTLPLPVGAPNSPLVTKISASPFILRRNALDAETVTFDFSRNMCSFGLGEGGRVHRVRCGLGEWIDGIFRMPGTPLDISHADGSAAAPSSPVRVAAAGAWKDGDTFEMQWRYFETPHADTVTCRFAGDEIKIEFLNSITQQQLAAQPALSPPHPETRPALVGRLATSFPMKGRERSGP